MSKRKYQTEEERLEARRESYRRYYEAHRDAKLAYKKQYREEHREELLDSYRKYNQEHREERRESNRRYHQEHREEKLAYKKQYRAEHQEERRTYNKYWRNETQIGRSRGLANLYKRKDLKYGRETTVTREWIMDHIFSSSCVYCGESDWHKLGCDRKDNSIGHTPENCVPCCSDCNNKRQRKGFSQFIGSQWGLWGRLNQSGSARTQYAVRLPLSAQRELEAEGRL